MHEPCLVEGSGRAGNLLVARVSEINSLKYFVA